ncbi:hypothetical protein ACQKWADRAFT_329964 [Trichoderma austrokoningii]
MTTPHSRKRHGSLHQDDSSQSSEQDEDLENEFEWQYPPKFWDGLSTVPLIHDALEELERRNRARPCCPSPPVDAQEFTPKEPARFARHGGPDLRHLRGYRHAGAMRISPRGRGTESTDTRIELIGPYHRAFEQHLTDHAVHPIWKSQEPDLKDTRAALAVSRPSLSLSKNLEPLTDGTVTPAKPDIYCGSYPEDLNRSIRNELAGHIVPSTVEDKPMAPNFFMEIKGPYGQAAVADLQARYSGAIGSRAIHSLQNYNEEEPIMYDGKPYTFTSTYYNGALKLYAHHVTAPTSPEGRPEYHMTKVNGYAITDSRDTFVKGVTAFRNARDLAKQYRDNFIQAANARASSAKTAAAQADVTEPGEDDISTPPTADDSQKASPEPAASDDDDPSGVSADPGRSKRPRQSLSLRFKTKGGRVLKRPKRPSTARRTRPI